MLNILFVCLGNICRSPMAEAVFKHLVEQADLSDKFQIDSVGTINHHKGELAHRGTRDILTKYGITINSISRKITSRDINQADYLIVMDYNNAADLRSMMRGESLNERLSLLLEFASNSKTMNVPDPYYTENFEEVYQLVKDGCEGLLAHIREEHEI